MDKLEQVKVSKKGQIVIPIKIRKELNLNEGSELLITTHNGQIQLKKKLTNLDWYNLVKEQPHEDVTIDKNGNYDPKKSPHFHKWMENG